MPEKAALIEKKLKELGLSNAAIHAAWPTWWSEEAEFSPSALNELRFSLSRKLGISPDTLFDEGNAEFLWDGDAKFKGLSAESQAEKAALVAYGSSIARLLTQALRADYFQFETLPSAEQLRRDILGSGATSVQLLELLGLSWSLGIPVIQLRVFPLTSKKMAAMTIRNGNRFAILIGRDAQHPSFVAYYVAHELGHIFQGHLSTNSAIVDIVMPDQVSERDGEEMAADRFGLTLLTGRADVQFTWSRAPRNGRELAHSVTNAGRQHNIDPGTLALCYAHKTGKWAIAQAALRYLGTSSRPVWKVVNQIAQTQLHLEQITPDNLHFLSSVLGLHTHAGRTH